MPARNQRKISAKLARNFALVNFYCNDINDMQLNKKSIFWRRRSKREKREKLPKNDR